MYDDVSAVQYHADPGADPTLSSSIAKVILDSTPRHAWTAHPRMNPSFVASDDTKFSVGSVAHEMLLGKGGGFDVLDFADWRSGGAKTARAKSWEAGRTPILGHQHLAAGEMVDAVVARLRVIPETLALFAGGSVSLGLENGYGERVLVWRDIGGPLCRAMIDWQGPSPAEVWDVKTTGYGLSDYELTRTIANLGYDLSAAFYLRGIAALMPEMAGRFRFRWIFVEDAEPFEVRVLEPTAEMLELGDRKAALAIAKWQDCISKDLWPGYPPVVTRVSPLAWAMERHLEREQNDDDAMRMVVSSRPVEHRERPVMGPC